MFQSAIKSYLQLHHFSQLSIKAVLFDMDGVLFDSMGHHAKAWSQAMKDVNIPFSELESYKYEGQIAQETINKTFFEHLGREATNEEKLAVYKIKSFYFESLGVTQVMPFAFELLQMIQKQGIQIYLVTGSAQASLIDSLQEHFPGIFQKERMVTALDVKQGKPFPEPYLKGLEQAGVKPWEAIVIENAPLGIQSSVAAGLFTIALNTGPLDNQLLLDSGANILMADGMQELYQEWNKFIEQTYFTQLTI